MSEKRILSLLSHFHFLPARACGAAATGCALHKAGCPPPALALDEALSGVHEKGTHTHTHKKKNIPMADLACPVCAASLTAFDLPARQAHANACLDGGSGSSRAGGARGGPAGPTGRPPAKRARAATAARRPRPASSSPDVSSCPVCAAPLSSYGALRRRAHVEACCEGRPEPDATEMLALADAAAGRPQAPAPPRPRRPPPCPRAAERGLLAALYPADAPADGRPARVRLPPSRLAADPPLAVAGVAVRGGRGGGGGSGSGGRAPAPAAPHRRAAPSLWAAAGSPSSAAATGGASPLRERTAARLAAALAEGEERLGGVVGAGGGGGAGWPGPPPPASAAIPTARAAVAAGALADPPRHPSVAATRAAALEDEVAAARAVVAGLEALAADARRAVG